MPQAHGKAEGQELSGLSTSQQSQAYWDDEQKQSLLLLSSVSDPLFILTHTLVVFLISFPLCLILATQSYRFLFP